MLTNQITVLEEGKALLSSEVILLRKQLADGIDNSAAIKQEKELISQRAAQMAAEIAEMKAKVDETSSQMSGLQAQVQTLQVQNK